MTSRRGTLVEEGARELLQLHGYSVRVLPPGFNKRLPPVHLIATGSSGETRFIRIQKLSHRSPTAESIERYCPNDFMQLRKYISTHPSAVGLRCEIWIYSLTHGFKCFEILADDIREIPKLPQNTLAVCRSRRSAA
jgi:hypothetical protein